MNTSSSQPLENRDSKHQSASASKSSASPVVENQHAASHDAGREARQQQLQAALKKQAEEDARNRIRQNAAQAVRNDKDKGKGLQNKRSARTSEVPLPEMGAQSKEKLARVRDIAYGHKAIIMSIFIPLMLVLLGFVLIILFGQGWMNSMRGGITEKLIQISMLLLQAVGAFLFCRGMQYRVITWIIHAVIVCIASVGLAISPIVFLGYIIYVNFVARKVLKERGIDVGFLGAKNIPAIYKK